MTQQMPQPQAAMEPPAMPEQLAVRDQVIVLADQAVPQQQAVSNSPAGTEPQAVSEPFTRLNDKPDWGYLLKEYYELYRFSSSGGSERIRGHMRTVREAINRLLKTNAPMLPTGPLDKPVTGHLSRALDEGRIGREARIVRAIDHLRSELRWQYGYERVPAGLARKYAFAEIAGPTGPVVSEDVILGLVLFAPGCVYPAHAHDGLTESYICLSGAVSENHLGVFAPGSMILNPPEHVHRITVSTDEPALLAYAWTGSREKLAAQKMVLGRQPQPPAKKPERKPGAAPRRG